ncbi:MAG: hypothetical protein JWM14_2314 [Chitinophagaceae bacterium]|nr:hypothetical protein [Chitinophagaceae bacterium]
MKQILISTLLILFIGLELSAQVTSNRIRFKYRINKHKLASLNNSGYQITDDKGNSYQFCDKLKKPFKCLINNKDGILSIDPWGINDKRINPSKTNVLDPCYDSLGTSTVINANTSNKLKLTLKSRTLVGAPTEAITLHYQTWIVGINVVGLKIRPSVKDYNDSIYSANVITGSINLGLNIGYSFGWTTFTQRTSNSWSITPSMAFGFSSASLSKEPLKKKITTTYTPNNFILSPSVSVIIARNDVGLIFSYGHDIMFGRHADAWAYQGKGFFAFGIVAGLKL